MHGITQPFLDDRFPLPLDRPFTTAQAHGVRLGPRDLGALVREGLLRRMLRGVLVSAQVPDSIALRCQAVALVTPHGAVVTDTTAGWLHGAEMVLAPNAHLHASPVSFFHRTPGLRSRWNMCDSGERTMPDTDVTEINGLEVTTALRTSLDMGRLLQRFRAFAALDSMWRLGIFEPDDAIDQIGRFKGYRGVCQLRALAPLADARSQSPGESALRLHWLDCPDLPRPTPQLAVEGPGTTYYLDLGVEELRFGAEYDGIEWHGPDRAAQDASRRSWMADNGDWQISVHRRNNVFGLHQDAGYRLRAAIREARLNFAARRRAS
jgi:hypothetical protein